MTALNTARPVAIGGRDRSPWRTAEMRLLGQYWIRACACRHPGGMHVIDRWEPRGTHCRGCGCTDYREGVFVVCGKERSVEMLKQP